MTGKGWYSRLQWNPSGLRLQQGEQRPQRQQRAGALLLVGQGRQDGSRCGWGESELFWCPDQVGRLDSTGYLLVIGRAQGLVLPTPEEP
jgi:hypothetical protein